MASLSFFPLQDLPVELEREIFETAARSWPSAALNIVLVTRQVRDWVRPLIYELVTLGGEDVPLFLRTMNDLPASFFANSVKKLCLTVSVEPHIAAHILGICSGVNGLALWVDFWRSSPRPSHPLSPLIISLPLRSLSIPLPFFLEISNDPACLATLLPNLCHLDLVYWPHASSAPSIPVLSPLSQLTRLGINAHYNLPKDYLLAIASQSTSLRVISVLVGDELEHIPIEDPRIVFSPYPDAITLDWEATMRHQESTWSVAEQIVEERLAELATLPPDPNRLWD